MRLWLIAMALLLVTAWAAEAQESPFQATGIKIGEVTPTSAIVWARLTRLPARLWDGVVPPKRPPEEPQLPEGVSVDQLQGATPGAPGLVRVTYRPRGGALVRATAWQAPRADADYATQFRLTGLTPETQYVIRVESMSLDGGRRGETLDGSFRTAPEPTAAAPVRFTVVTGQEYHDRDDPEGFRAYRAMLALDPSFFVHTGDIVYYDKQGPWVRSPALARFHWARLYSFPTLIQFHRRVPSYFIKDDHDTWQNDCWPTMANQRMGDFTFAQGQAVFLDQVPMGDRTYRTFRWGRDLQIWLMEGRDFRSPNNLADGPEKSIWGPEQKAWLKRTVLESEATFRVLISPTPIVGPDRENKHDNHSNQDFAHEGNEIRQWIRDSAPDLVVVCGDRHWQYVSVDPETGVREYCSGPLSDQHAGGFSDKVEAYHRYFNLVGGFLSGTVERVDGAPRLTFRHHSVDGEVLYQDRLDADSRE